MAQVHALQKKKRFVAVTGVLVALVAFALSIFISLNSSFVINKSQSIEATDQSLTGESPSSTTLAASSESVVIIHIDGAVQAPGVYELKEGARTNDAVAKAGGLTEQADTSTVNLAAKLTDGQKIHIPTHEEAEASASSSTASGVDTSNNSSLGTSLVNINSATAEELDTLPGVGPSTAATIIQDRETSGPFYSIEDLMRVDGIGEKKFAKLKDYICV